jgi:hypothetical protein
LIQQRENLATGRPATLARRQAAKEPSDQTERRPHYDGLMRLHHKHSDEPDRKGYIREAQADVTMAIGWAFIRPLHARWARSRSTSRILRSNTRRMLVSSSSHFRQWKRRDFITQLAGAAEPCPWTRCRHQTWWVLTLLPSSFDLVGPSVQTWG